jgi:anti-sigma regulatory factor (Ser/Thr protein kinase)
MRLKVFPTIEAPSQSRRELSALAGRVDQGLLSDIRTVVSELVGMSVANGAREPIEVSLLIEERHIEGTVHDDGTAARAVDREESALAIRILDGLVEEWKADEREKRIWFRINTCSA